MEKDKDNDDPAVFILFESDQMIHNCLGLPTWGTFQPPGNIPPLVQGRRKGFICLWYYAHYLYRSNPSAVQGFFLRILDRVATKCSPECLVYDCDGKRQEGMSGLEITVGQRTISG